MGLVEQPLIRATQQADAARARLMERGDVDSFLADRIRADAQEIITKEHWGEDGPRPWSELTPEAAKGAATIFAEQYGVDDPVLLKLVEHYATAHAAMIIQIESMVEQGRMH